MPCVHIYSFFKNFSYKRIITYWILLIHKTCNNPHVKNWLCRAQDNFVFFIHLSIILLS